MKAIYRTVSALLAILSGFVIAGLVTVILDDREIRVVWFVVFAAGALLAAAAAVVLWSRSFSRK